MLYKIIDLSKIGEKVGDWMEWFTTTNYRQSDKCIKTR